MRWIVVVPVIVVVGELIHVEIFAVTPFPIFRESRWAGNGVWSGCSTGLVAVSGCARDERVEEQRLRYLRERFNMRRPSFPKNGHELGTAG
jgi:hypothetical protein